MEVDASPPPPPLPRWAVQIPFVALNKARNQSAFPVREIEKHWNVDRLAFKHTSMLDPLSDTDFNYIINQIHSTHFQKPLVSWVDTLVLEASKSQQAKKDIIKLFPVPHDINKVVLSNVVTANKTADVATAGVLIHNLVELIDPVTLEFLALVVFPHVEGVEFVESALEADTKWEVIQTSTNAMESDFFMLIDPTNNGKSTSDKKRLFLPGFQRPKFTSSFRLIDDKKVLTIDFLLHCLEAFLDLSDKIIAHAPEAYQLVQLEFAIYKILDLFIALTQHALLPKIQNIESIQRYHFSEYTMCSLNDHLTLKADNVNTVQWRKINEFSSRFTTLLRKTDNEKIVDFVMFLVDYQFL